MNGTLSVRDLHVSHGALPILRGVSLDVAHGEVCALMGVSGAGKSTVLRAIAALQAFDSGSVNVNGVALSPGAVPPESRLRELRRQVGVVFQSSALFEHLSVIDNVMLAPLHVLKWTHAKAHETAMSLLDSLGVAARAQAFPRQLSGGEAQRVAIARALAPNPHFLLMDEPTSALDPARRTALGVSLRQLAAEGRGLLIVTHDAEFARNHADTAIMLQNGIVSARGTAGQLLEGLTADRSSP